jgi:hypothetical protein
LNNWNFGLLLLLFWNNNYWDNYLLENIYKLELRKKSHFGVKRFLREKQRSDRERGKGQRQSKRKKVGEEKSLKLEICRINSGKGGLSSVKGYYMIICTG